MKVEIKIPAMGESVNEATIAAIIKANGSHVTIDEEIVELETDKVNQVLFAPESGQLNLTVSEEDTVAIGDVIGFVDTSVQGKKETTPPSPVPITVEKDTAPPPFPSQDKEKTTSPQISNPEENLRFSIEEHIQEIKTPPTTTTTTASTTIPSTSAPKVRETRKKMTKIRETIAKHLVGAKQNTAMLTTFNEVDMSAIMKLRKEIQDDFIKKHETKLGFMSPFVKACVHALQDIPLLNAYIDGSDIVQRHTYDIGIAVSTPRGLVVPVIKDCDQLSFAGIEKNLANYAKKAREGGLTLSDLQGGGFTITNGGTFGSLLSTPILNPPQSGILGMHKIQERPVAENGQVVIRPMMYVALSYDHRIVDGKEAVTFLVKVKQALENPHRLLLEI